MTSEAGFPTENTNQEKLRKISDEEITLKAKQALEARFSNLENNLNSAFASRGEKAIAEAENAFNSFKSAVQLMVNNLGVAQKDDSLRGSEEMAMYAGYTKEDLRVLQEEIEREIGYKINEVAGKIAEKIRTYSEQRIKQLFSRFG
jgi:ElaB/YqjD/DUF883 family membrane-anchored ribosome-binding protein